MCTAVRGRRVEMEGAGAGRERVFGFARERESSRELHRLMEHELVHMG
jgi:hypothetical protein